MDSRLGYGAIALAALIVAGTAAAQSEPPAPSPSSTRPNVLFIAIDDLNDWVGVLRGHPQARTPNIDRLAARGLLFENAHAPAPSCTPSRSAVLSGISPATSGIYNNRSRMRNSPVLKTAVTLPGYFRENGYLAIGSGKIFGIGMGDGRSWDRYVPSAEREVFEWAYPELQNFNGLGEKQLDWGEIGIEDVHRISDTRTVDWVVEQLGKRHEKPLFLGCGIFRPHLPWYVPREFFDQLPLKDVQLPIVRTDDLKDLPAMGVAVARHDGLHERIASAGLWKEAVRAYLASVAYADQQVGRVLRALDRGPNAKDTIVVLWSDHGFHLGEKEHWRKVTLWERVTRVPLIIAAPGVVAPGGRTGAAVSLLDLYPTLVDLAGLPPRETLEGTSLMPLLRDPKASWNRAVVTTNSPGNHAVRSEHFRLIQYSDGGAELYDHRVDPNEWNNLALDRRYAAVRKELEGWLPEESSPAR